MNDDAAVDRHDARHLVWLRDQLGDRFAAGVVLHTGSDAECAWLNPRKANTHLMTSVLHPIGCVSRHQSTRWVGLAGPVGARAERDEDDAGEDCGERQGDAPPLRRYV